MDLLQYLDQLGVTEVTGFTQGKTLCLSGRGSHGLGVFVEFEPSTAMPKHADRPVTLKVDDLRGEGKFAVVMDRVYQDSAIARWAPKVEEKSSQSWLPRLGSLTPISNQVLELMPAFPNFMQSGITGGTNLVFQNGEAIEVGPGWVRRASKDPTGSVRYSVPPIVMWTNIEEIGRAQWLDADDQVKEGWSAKIQNLGKSFNHGHDRVLVWGENYQGTDYSENFQALDTMLVDRTSLFVRISLKHVAHWTDKTHDVTIKFEDGTVRLFDEEEHKVLENLKPEQPFRELEIKVPADLLVAALGPSLCYERSAWFEIDAQQRVVRIMTEDLVHQAAIMGSRWDWSS